MSKNSWIMFGMVAVVLISIFLVALLILVPQSNPIVVSGIEEYKSITEADFTYTSSKDISGENLKETYSITSEDVNEGKASKVYKPGNTDPFADQKATSSDTTNNSNSGTSNSGGSNANQSTTNNNTSTTNKPISAEDK